MALPTITIFGNTTGPAELRFTPSGKPVTDITVIANKRRKTESGGWEDADRSPFIRATFWDQDAETVAEALCEGTAKVIVTGQLKAREYDANDGTKRESIELDFPTLGIVPRPPRSERERTTNGNRPAQQSDPWAVPQPQQGGDPWAQPTDDPPF